MPEIKSLNHFDEIIKVRATADSEALRLKYSNKNVFERFKPKGEISEKLYRIAEKIRYEKIGSQEFSGIKKNISTAFNEKTSNLSSKESFNKNKKKVLIDKKFESYMRSLFFRTNKKNSIDIKKNKKELDKYFKNDIEFLKKNLKNQEIFNKTISRIISKIDIEEQKRVLKTMFLTKKDLII